MPGKSASERRALDALGAVILPLFEQAGFDYIEPDILQPADVFLDSSGEDIRSRTYVFTDPAGAELCLRPDLTVPACRYYLSHGFTGGEARYCYAGKAFRFQPGGGDVLHPREFDQAGLEWFAAPDREAAEVEVLRLAVAAVDAAGLAGYRIQLGDLRLFHALLDAIAMPARWRRRLRHHFWRPRAFRAELQVLTGARERPPSSLAPLVDTLASGDEAAAVALVESLLDQRGLQLVGGRSVEEIALRLAEKKLDRTETPLPRLDSALIDAYLAVRAGPREALARIGELAAGRGEGLAAALAAFARRLDLMERAGLDLAAMEFAAVFGRSLEYYTGFVFQIDMEGAGGGLLPIAGGGRYDSLLAEIGAPDEVPAVGCAIHTERLLALSARGRS